MGNLNFSVLDVLKAPRLAFSPQRILIATFGIMTAHLLFLGGAWLSAVLSGLSFTSLWQTYGLFYFPVSGSFPLLPKFLFLLTAALASLIFLATNLATARSIYMVLRDYLFYTGGQAWRFAGRQFASLLGIYITFIFLIVPFILGAGLMSALGQVAWLGEIINALATLPYIFAGMILVFLTIGFFISFVFGPAIIAVSEEDGFGAATQALHLTWGQPVRLVLFIIFTFLEVLFAVLFFAFILKIGLIIYSVLFMPLMHSLAPMLDHALYQVQIAMGPADDFLRNQLGQAGIKVLYLKKDYLALSLPVSTAIASNIVFIFLLFAAYMTAGYAIAVANAGIVIGYLNLQYYLNNVNLLERKDSEILNSGEAEIEIKKDDFKILQEKPE